MVKGGIRTTEEKPEKEKEESKIETLAKNLEKLVNVVATHESRIKKLEDELW